MAANDQPVGRIVIEVYMLRTMRGGSNGVARSFFTFLRRSLSYFSCSNHFVFDTFDWITLAPRWRCAEDGRELPRPVHWWEGLRLQELHLPPDHPELHVPGRWLHQPQRHRRKVDLWREVRGWGAYTYHFYGDNNLTLNLLDRTSPWSTPAPASCRWLMLVMYFG